MEKVLILVAGVALAALILNLPFGYLRAPVKKFSVKWFLYIHLPIPFIFVLRKLAGLDRRAIPFIVAGAVIGQIIGARINPKKAKKRSTHEGETDEASG